MAVLINGNGNEAIYAQQDADWFASIMGNQTAITAIGSKFAATLEDANTIGVADGVIITQEGRRIQLDVNEIDLFDIPAGGQGETNYYIIGYHLVTGDLSEQSCETFVRLMDNATDTIPEDTFRSGADEVFVSLYRVTQVNLAITDMELLLPEITTVAQLSQHLTEQFGGYKYKLFYKDVHFVNGYYSLDTNIRSYTEMYVLLSNFGITCKLSNRGITNGIISIASTKLSNETLPTYDDTITVLVIYK